MCSNRVPTLALALLLAVPALAAACTDEDEDVNVTGTAPETTTTTTEAETTTTTEPETTTTTQAAAECSAAGLPPEAQPQPDLPEPVGRTRAELRRLAVACDYEGLAALAGQGDDGFTYSFGDEGAPAAFWQQAEDGGFEPMRYLAELLDRPIGMIEVEGGTQYVWPSAFAAPSWAEVPPEAREALRPLYDDEDFAQFEQAGAYIGHRIGVADDGEWLFFVSGD